MKKIISKLKEEAGFTLIEMLIVILIISVLLILVVTNLGGVNDQITNTKNRGIIQTVESQMLIYEMEKGNKPSAEKLYEEKYISDKQFEAYKLAKKSAVPNP